MKNNWFSRKTKKKKITGFILVSCCYTKMFLGIYEKSGVSHVMLLIRGLAAA